MELTEELLVKAKAAKSAEELLTLAHENGMKEFTEENAKAYFEQLHKSGEVSDDELDNVAGGCSGTGEESSRKCPNCGSKMIVVKGCNMLTPISGNCDLCPTCGYKRIFG